MSDPANPVLDLQAVHVGIEGVPVLRDVAFALPAGITAALLGRNGAGKTTTLRTIMGFVRQRSGHVRLLGRPLDDLPPHRRPAEGIGYAPEDRRLFSAFDVETNITLPARVARLPAAEATARLDRVYGLLPELRELRQRPAGSVSGGQGKMVALARALMMGTRLVLLDEPFQGLAPALAQRYAQALGELRRTLPDLTVLITESNPGLLREIADLAFEIERGEVAPIRLQSQGAAATG